MPSGAVSITSCVVGAICATGLTATVSASGVGTVTTAHVYLAEED